MKFKFSAVMLLTFGAAQAQFSGPNEARQPRSAEAFALGKAVCASKLWLGEVSDCHLETVPNAYTPTLKAGKRSYLLWAVLYGSFSQPNRKEVLAQFCQETEGCFGSLVLLRQTGQTWKVMGHLPDSFTFGSCLKYPAKGGTDAVACLGVGNYPGQTLNVVRWNKGKAQVEQMFRFRWLSLSPIESAQCRERWNVRPFFWNDRDRNADGRPDLSISVVLEQFQKTQEKCVMGMDEPTLKTDRAELAFHWNGLNMIPTPATRDFIERYGVTAP